MVNMIMASSRALIIGSISTPKLKPQSQPSLPKIWQPNKGQHLAAAAATLTLTHSPLSLAADIEKAALFDFNLTLPIIAAEFLFLMLAMDKLCYSPLGKFMDERDAAIREKLNRKYLLRIRGFTIAT